MKHDYDRSYLIDGMLGPYTQDTPEPAPIYEVHDIVEFNGATGVIVAITDDPHTLMKDYPIKVKMDANGQILYFTPEGKFLKEMHNRSLTVIGRSRAIKKHTYAYLAIDGVWKTSPFALTEEEASTIYSTTKKLKIEESEVIE